MSEVIPFRKDGFPEGSYDIPKGRIIGVYDFGPGYGDMLIRAMEDLEFLGKSNRGKHYIGSQTDERIVVNNFERVIDLGDIEYGFPGLETPELHSVNNLEVDSSKK